ncbi:MAG: HEPN domain-containing protein [Anaerolineaceae bacterium]|nr:HEPN domain-containing protein [Anaerolineaceae bacterium]
MQPHDLGRKFLELAMRDRIALRVLRTDGDVADETIGFHAQQAVEKCLKAVLILYKIEYRRTHNLDELIDLLQENALPLPPNLDDLDMLTPYAVLMRYDFSVSESLNRDQTMILVKDVYDWANGLIGNDNN